ncbi:hypothetical protein [Methylobacterium sp. NFXW15]|uniref:hypothetical protein n=1 Tax=Methylobacterium sp. NFXW15 TaxID=2819512 RepID=UPI003CE794A6
MQDHDSIDAERRLHRSVDSVLRLIHAAQAERQAPPVQAARQQLGQIYRATRLARAKERLSAS